jgi:hypothetical protein
MRVVACWLAVLLLFQSVKRTAMDIDRFMHYKTI